MPSAPLPRARAGVNQACVLYISLVVETTEGQAPRGIKQKGQAVKHLKGGNTEEDKCGMGRRSRENDGVVLVFLGPV